MSAPQATLIDDLQASGARLPRALSVHPAVADTSALLSDLIASVNFDQTSPLLIAMKVGVVRVYIPHHVWAEVPRKIATLDAKRLHDCQTAETLWWTEYVPLLRVLDAGTMPTAPTALAMIDRDPTDLPTACVRDLLAPIVVLATDTDLIDLGLAHDNWRLIAKDGGTVAMAGGSSYFGLLLTVSAGHGVVAATRALWQVLKNPWVQASIVSAALLLHATHDLWRPRANARMARIRAGAVTAFDAVEAVIDDFGPRLALAYQRWDQATAGDPGITITHRVARVLVTAPPLTRRDIAERLYPEATEIELRRAVHDLSAVLEDCSAFVQVRRGRWQLGRAGADFVVGGAMAALAAGQ